MSWRQENLCGLLALLPLYQQYSGVGFRISGNLNMEKNCPYFLLRYKLLRSIVQCATHHGVWYRNMDYYLNLWSSLRQLPDLVNPLKALRRTCGVMCVEQMCKRRGSYHQLEIRVYNQFIACDDIFRRLINRILVCGVVLSWQTLAKPSSLFICITQYLNCIVCDFITFYLWLYYVAIGFAYKKPDTKNLHQLLP